MELQDAFALTPLQQGMLTDALAKPRDGVDFEQLVVHAREAFDADRLEASWRQLTDRHEVLRTRFVCDGAVPRQEVLASVAVPVLVQHARLDAGGRQSLLDTFLANDRRSGFDLGAGAPHRVTVFRWDEQTWTLVWTFHHSLLDGRSFAPLLVELFDVYEELRRGTSRPRPSLPRYRSYVEWLERQDPAPAEAHWRALLTGFAAPTPLTANLPGLPESVPNPLGEAWTELDGPATARLHAVARDAGVTINACLMAAWAILLHRYSGEDDVVFGATRTCRHGVPDGPETIGLLINTLPVRVRFRPEMSALEVCTAIRQQWLAARGHEHLSPSRIKALSEVPSDQALFESLVVFERQTLEASLRAASPTWNSRRVELHELTTFPVTIAAYDGPTLSIKVSFDSRRLDGRSIARMTRHLRAILGHLADAPLTRVDRVPLLDAPERDALLARAGGARSPVPGHLPLEGDATLSRLFETAVARRPQAVAVSCEDRSLTYAELLATADRIARGLAAHGAKPGAIVAICLDRTVDLPVAILGVLRAGCAYLPIDAACPPDRTAFMLEDARAALVLTDDASVDRLPANGPPVLRMAALRLQAAGAAGGGPAWQPPRILPDDLAYIIYTSGTTGSPKGALITHRNVVRLLAHTEAWFAFGHRDVWTLFHSSAFDFSVWEIWGALLYGGRLVVVPFATTRSPETFYALLARERVTVLNQTPSAFRQLMRADETLAAPPLALRYVIFGGEALDPSSLRSWFDRHGDQTPRLVNMYGITETTVHVTYRPLTRADLASGSVIGEPIADLRIYILDPAGEPVPVGVPGEMYVGGAGLARGYLRRPELTAERFVADPFASLPDARMYKTGDRARWLPDGDIEYLGRLDHQVKIRGYRIETGEIESVLARHPSVREALVVARDGRDLGKRLVAYIVARDGEPDLEDIRAHLCRHLAEYMVPAAFVCIPALPLTANGKIDRRALPEPSDLRPPVAAGFVAPRTIVERTLAGIWSSLLHVDAVGVRTNFYALGGDSILGLHVLSQARAAGLVLPPQEFFTCQTIEQQARLADAAAARVDHGETGPGQGDATPPEAAARRAIPWAPIQRWFLEQRLDRPHHYNQAFIFETAVPLDRAALQQALDTVQRHHEALRFRVTSSSATPELRVADADTPAALEWVGLDPQDAADQHRLQIEATAAAMQARLDLERGPIWRTAYFARGAGEAGLLLVVVHHLAVDGASWAVLAEDVDTAYAAACSGQPASLRRTSSYLDWTTWLSRYAHSEQVQQEREHWRVAGQASEPSGAVAACVDAARADARERASRVVVSRLTARETTALLHAVPAAFDVQINDVLLTALGRANAQCGGGSTLWLALEGHGREHLADALDLSRTVGWFTSIFPVRLTQAQAASGWDAGRALLATKRQLRCVPRKGVGYGLLRYGASTPVTADAEPPLLVNYLGQLDRMTSGSTLFRRANAPTGPWHDANQRRRYPLELNAAVVDGRLELAWTASARADAGAAVSGLNDALLSALRELIARGQAGEVHRDAADYPLARLDQPALDRLVALAPDLEDVYPLSPMQKLFVSAGRGSMAAFDQWHCCLDGPLDSVAFQQAWDDTLRRHSVLRSTIHVEGLAEPLQVVHREVHSRWTVEDWRDLSPAACKARWGAFLAGDRQQPMRLQDPLMRFALVRQGDASWKFCWSVASLLLDGWSWPLVFADVSRSYEARQGGEISPVPPARPYRDYIDWLAASRGAAASLAFWRAELAGVHAPTPLPPPASGSRQASWSRTSTLSPRSSAAVGVLARRLEVSVNAVVQASWALVLSRQAGTPDVVFGAACSGRPPGLPDAETIVGPFVTNVPVRVAIDPARPFADLCRTVHARTLASAPHQYMSLADIQCVSEVGWRQRLFDSLLVFQNYGVGADASRVGRQVALRDFAGPVHSGYPVLVLVEPSEVLRLTVLVDGASVSTAAADAWADDLTRLLERAPEAADAPVAHVARGLRTTTWRPQPVEPRTGLGTSRVTPRTQMERDVAEVWCRLCGVDGVGIDETFFEMGGTSLLLLQFHKELRARCAVDFPIVDLFEHPTVRALARALQPSVPVRQPVADGRARAARQRSVIAHRRERHSG